MSHDTSDIALLIGCKDEGVPANAEVTGYIGAEAVGAVAGGGQAYNGESEAICGKGNKIPGNEISQLLVNSYRPGRGNHAGRSRRSRENGSAKQAGYQEDFGANVHGGECYLHLC